MVTEVVTLSIILGCWGLAFGVFMLVRVQSEMLSELRDIKAAMLTVVSLMIARDTVLYPAQAHDIRELVDEMARQSLVKDTLCKPDGPPSAAKL